MELAEKIEKVTQSLPVKLTQHEYRDVGCAWTFDYKKDIKTLTRLDTGEAVRTTQLTIGDRQGKLL